MVVLPRALHGDLVDPERAPDHASVREGGAEHPVDGRAPLLVVHLARWRRLDEPERRVDHVVPERLVPGVAGPAGLGRSAEPHAQVRARWREHVRALGLQLDAWAQHAARDAVDAGR